MDELTEDDLLAAIAPKSDQLNACDVEIEPLTVTIKNALRGNAEQLVVLEIEGDRPLRPWKPCKGMSRILAATYGKKPTGWIGKRVRLVHDPEVCYGGKKVGGIRLSHLSGLTEPRTYKVVVSRNKTIEVTLYPLEDAPSPEDKTLIEAFKADIANADTLEVLKATGFILKEHSKAIRDALRGDYERRQKELTAG